MRAGERVDAGEALALYHEAPLSLLGRLADRIRARKHPDGIVTYIIDRNVNYTNVCVARCKFCAFYRPVGSARATPSGSTRSSGRSTRRSRSAAGSCCCRAATIPTFRSSWYEDLFRAVKQRYPAFRLHALSPPEVIHISRLSQLAGARGDRPVDRGGARQHSGGRRGDSRRSRPQAPELLRQGHGRRVAGRDAPGAPGRAADHGDDDVRHGRDDGGAAGAPVPPARAPGRNRRLHGVHRLELPAASTPNSAATRRPGSSTCARWRSRGSSSTTSTSLQASWVTQGGKVGQLSLAYGANDMGSVMIEENVVRAAGAEYCMDEFEIVRNIENAGFVAKRRNMHYEILGDPFFRERDVPRHAGAGHRRGPMATRAGPASCRPTRRAAPRRRRSASRRRRSRTAAAWVTSHRQLAMPVRRRLVVRGRSRQPIVLEWPRWAALRPARGRTGRAATSAPSRLLPGPGQRAHASRAVLDGRPGAAGARRWAMDRRADVRCGAAGAPSGDASPRPSARPDARDRHGAGR